ncbi:MAG: hypothetical protein IJU98_08220 [Synergistaceae bacterium]|nr:hypothetical protein [Synergistaceae bacterium]
MELSREGLTSWGQRYEWVFGGDVTLYHDASGMNRRLVTYLNTRSGLPFEMDYMDDEPDAFSTAERREWIALCQYLFILEQDLYDQIMDELRRYADRQVREMRGENPNRRVIPADEYDLLYQGARNAVASALSVPVHDIDILNYEEGANIIDLWFGDLLEAEGYILED